MIKYLIVFVLFLPLGFSSLAQSKGGSQYDVYTQKIEKYKGMKVGGIALVTLGTVGTVTGFTRISLSKGFDGNNDPDAQHEKNTKGAVLIGLGFATILGGATLIAKGSKNVKKYRKLRDNIDLGYYQMDGAKGVSLSLRF